MRTEYAKEDLLAGHINRDFVNRAVIAPEFRDKRTDMICKSVLKTHVPRREIVRLNMDALAAGGGGGIHGATQQKPRQTG